MFDEVSDLAADRGASPAQLALAWVLNDPDVTSALIGVGAPEQFAELLGATAVDLTYHESTVLEGVTSIEGLRVLKTRPAWGPASAFVSRATRRYAADVVAAFRTASITRVVIGSQKHAG